MRIGTSADAASAVHDWAFRGHGAPRDAAVGQGELRYPAPTSSAAGRLGPRPIRWRQGHLHGDQQRRVGVAEDVDARPTDQAVLLSGRLGRGYPAQAPEGTGVPLAAFGAAEVRRRAEGLAPDAEDPGGRHGPARRHRAARCRHGACPRLVPTFRQGPLCAGSPGCAEPCALLVDRLLLPQAGRDGSSGDAAQSPRLRKSNPRVSGLGRGNGKSHHVAANRAAEPRLSAACWRGPMRSRRRISGGSALRFSDRCADRVCRGRGCRNGSGPASATAR